MESTVNSPVRWTTANLEIFEGDRAKIRRSQYYKQELHEKYRVPT